MKAPPANQTRASPTGAQHCYDSNDIAEAFARAGAPAPHVIWQPHAGIVLCRSTTTFHLACDQIAQNSGSIAMEDLDLAYFGSMKDWLAVLEPIADDRGFRYTHFGREIARTYGQDMTGKTTNDFPDHIRQFYNAIFKDVSERKERVLTVHQPPDQVFATVWRRLIVPLIDRSGKAAQILAFNYPDNELRAGLEILPAPVLIVDAQHIVRHANKSARQNFDAGHYGPWTRSVFDYAGLDLEIRERPEDILAGGITQTSICRHLRHLRIGQYHATISAAPYKGTVFYVVLLQPVH
ncbi:hypothetical protein AB9K34_04160 [Sedimentitalea sp. XS_ASV28]|uniref:hypothetical protein n=1 Tax=Sedimentitalea sp. XS_ASV28 TaxID=3241296 RepID=UPI00351534B5